VTRNLVAMNTRGVGFLLIAFAPSLARAQSLEPRLYLPLPTGLNVIALSYAYSSGSVVVDGTTIVTDAHVTLHNGVVALVRTFGLAGRSAQVQAVAPITYGNAHALVSGQQASRDLRGLADPQLRLAVNLVGGPARRRSELAGVRFGTIVGASLNLSLPLGHVDQDRIVNVGANRWAVKPEIGVVQPLGRGWAVEVYTGVWLFGDNTAYLDTSIVTQQPLVTLQGHVIRLLGRRGWLAFDATLVRGGTTAVDGESKTNFQKNARLGATGAWFLGQGHAVKAAVSFGAYTRVGGDFQMFTVGYSYSWE
jgi:hypothetical protein